MYIVKFFYFEIKRIKKKIVEIFKDLRYYGENIEIENLYLF